MAACDAGEQRSIRATLVASIERLARAGAAFFVRSRQHRPYCTREPRRSVSPPRPSHRRGGRRTGCTRRTREGRHPRHALHDERPVYRRALGTRNIAAEIPDEDDQEIVHRIIFEELVNGVFTEASRAAYVRIIERLRERGCDAVALVCTEIPLLISPDVSPLPVLDSTRLLARAAFKVAVGRRAIPVWRGGAVI